VTNKMGMYKIWLLNVNTGKKTKIFKREYKLEQITDHSYPVLAWHPSSRYLAFITVEKGMLKLYYYNISEKKLTVRNFLYFEKVLDFSFSSDGSQFVFTGTMKGKTDIYVYDIASSTSRPITNDRADDYMPRFIDNDSKIIFCSNRVSDSLSVAEKKPDRAITSDLFIYDLKSGSDMLMRLDENYLSNNSYPEEINHNRFIQLNDRSGVVNRYISKFDSTVSVIDTAIHYRYYAETAPLTDYSRNILEQDYNKPSDHVAEIFYFKGRYNLYYNPVNDLTPLTGKIDPTSSQKARRKLWAAKDSVQQVEKKVIPIASIANNQVINNTDTVVLASDLIDVNHYVFEIEKINAYNEKLGKDNIKITADTAQKEAPKIRIYMPVFYQNSLVTQADFNFLNASYQAFTGGAFYFNPGFNVLMKVGANDLFEDYKITGGVRLSPSLDANEYLLSFENLKRRLDKMYIFHREVFENDGIDEIGDFSVKTYSHMGSVVLRYPLNQVKSLSATASYRNDRTVYLINNISTSPPQSRLDEPDIHKNWLGLKFEYIFDDTRSLGSNLYAGMRYKIFAEVQEQVYHDFYELVVFGADIRHYLQLHRSLIWANRFAWSTSQGTGRIIYYLGGVDNWINVTPRKNPTFLSFDETPIDQTQNYAFQAVGTNLRGFSQNIRNGNNFAVFNSEIRFPIFKYLANYPLSKSFFDNFQLVGFFDAGSAWSGGLTPWNCHNAYDVNTIQQGNITITVHTDKKPIVAGYGFGIHTQFLGYFIRLDWAWGIQNGHVDNHIFYLSTSLDF